MLPMKLPKVLCAYLDHETQKADDQNRGVEWTASYKLPHCPCIPSLHTRLLATLERKSRLSSVRTWEYGFPPKRDAHLFRPVLVYWLIVFNQ